MKKKSLILVATLGSGLAVFTSSPEPADQPGDVASVAASAHTAATGPADAGPVARGRQEVDAAVGPYGAPAGRQLVYRVESRSDVAVSSEAKHGTGAASTLAATLELVIAARKPDCIEALARFRDVRRSATPPVPAREAARELEALARPVGLRFALDGTLTHYRFAKELTGAQRNVVRGVIAPFVLPHSRQAARKIELPDSTGRYEAQLHCSATAGGWRVVRDKLRYVTVPEALGADSVDTCSGRATGELSRAVGWLVAARADDAIRLALPLGEMTVDYRERAHMRLVSHSMVAPPELDDDGWSDAAGHDEDIRDVIAERSEQRWRERLRDVDPATLVARIAKLASTGAADSEAAWTARTELAWLLRFDPKATGQVAAALRRGVAPNAADLLLGALATAGTASTQGVLADLLESPSFRMKDIVAAAAHQIERPASRLRGLLAGLVDRSAQLDGTAAAGVLALGSMARRPDERGEDGLASLLASRDKLAARGALDVWIQALGNAGGVDLLPRVAPHASSREEHVRAAVAGSLRRIGGGESRSLLVRMAQSDRAPGVRMQAVVSLGLRSDEPGVTGALTGIATRDRDPDVRREALLALARRGRAGRSALIQAERSDPDPQLRRLAGELLARS